MEDDKILFAKKDSICFIKIVGSIKCTNISGFDVFIERLIHNESIKDVLIDLSKATYIDSTNLGLLVEIARRWLQKYNKKPTIISINKKINELIDNIGVDRVFIVIKNPETFVGELQEIPGIDQDEREKARMILQAHKNIMAISDANTSLFKDVVETLENQLDLPNE